MFGKKETAVVRITSILGPGANVQGDFTAEGSARIDGIVKGKVKVTGTLIVGSAGKIYGDVEAESIVIGGEIQGNVFAPMGVELTQRAKVTGDVTTKDIEMDEEAVLVGRCNVYEETSDGKRKLVIPSFLKHPHRLRYSPMCPNLTNMLFLSLQNNYQYMPCDYRNTNIHPKVFHQP